MGRGIPWALRPKIYDARVAPLKGSEENLADEGPAVRVHLDKDGAAEIKRGDNESQEQNCPNTVESDSRVGGKSACAHPDAFVVLAEFNSSR